MGIRKWYIPLILLLFTAFVPWGKENNRVGELEDKLRLKNAPQYSLEQIHSEMRWVQEKEDLWAFNEKKGVPPTLSDNPGAYWEFLNRRRMLEDALLRFVEEQDYPAKAEARERYRILTTIPKTSLVNESFSQKFGISRMDSTRPENGYTPVRSTFPDVPDDGRMYLFIQSYLWSIPIMFLVFCVKLRARDLLVWPELHWITLASVCWLVGLFLYPRNLRREEQLKRAVRFVAELASASVGLFGFGAVPVLKAQIQPKGKTASGQKSEKRFSFASGLEFYPITGGRDAGLLVAPWYSHKESLWGGLSLSGFGFVEAGKRKSQLFANNSLNLTHKDSGGFLFTTEVGGSPAGPFVQVGPRLNLVRTPFVGNGVGKAMKSVVVGRGWRVRGPTRFQENYLSWISRELSLFKGLTVATEGFMRFRIGKAVAAGEPQVILRHKKLKHLDFLTEFWMIGLDPTVRFGIQLH